MARTILVTGGAGFIGFHTTLRLLERGDRVVGLDNLNDYYDVSLKQSRLKLLEANESFHFERVDLTDADDVGDVFRVNGFDKVVHLAAQVGVRNSVDNPGAYVDSNIVGFLHILEGCRHHQIKHLVYASSSSVYGNNTATPFSVKHNVDHPVSLYAASKKSNELMAHTYSQLFGLPTTGLRFFTVYGPWGRPDMALSIFTRTILEGRPIEVFNYGDMERDFTYIDDVVEGLLRTLDLRTNPTSKVTNDAPGPVTSNAPFRLYNIGSSKPVSLTVMIELLEECLGRTAQKNLMPMQPGDMRATCANIDSLVQDTGYRPTTSLRDGIQAFVDWYCDYYPMER